MEYLIVENRRTVLLGPMTWKPRLIQSEFDDLEINYIVPPGEPNQYLSIYDQLTGENTGIEIFPVAIETVEHNTRLHQLAGPFYTFENNLAYGTYTVLQRPLHEIKDVLKSECATIRYSREIAGTSIDIQGITVELDTSREGRIKYLDLVSSVSDQTIQYKTNNGFLELDKVLLQNMYDTVFSYIQAQFLWEKNMLTAIDSSTTFEELENILTQIYTPG